MRTNEQGNRSFPYLTTLGMIALAVAFPIALMIFDPDLMFRRGWEQYVGTSLYFCAVLMLARETMRVWSNDGAFADAPTLLGRLTATAETPPKVADDDRVLSARIAQLATYRQGSVTPTVDQLMEINRDASALDQEHASARFTVTKYILYLLPVIGFIGTVEGISKALLNMSNVLPKVKDLDGFIGELPKVTGALQVAFDSTLLALFLSAALMLAQTLVYRLSEDLLARIDRWVVGHALPRMGGDGAGPGHASAQLDRVRKELTEVLMSFTATVERLPASLGGFQRGAEAIGRAGKDLESLGQASEAIRQGVTSLARVENFLTTQNGPNEHLLEIKRGLDRNGEAVEMLANSLAHAFERSNRASQEQLARTMLSLKDALDLLNVSMEQGNALYRSIVKQMFRGEVRGFSVTSEDAA